jgi:UPF0755 protein
VSKRSFRIALAVVVGTVLVLGCIALVAWHRIRNYPFEARAGKGQEVVVAIEPGMTFPKIAERLSDKGVINRPRWFRLYAMQRGVTTRVRIGEYRLKDNMTPEAVLDRLIEGVKDVTVDVTIPEGLNMLEAFALLAKSGAVDRAALEAAARDPEVLKKLGIQGDTIEGYVFPETYKLKVPSKPQEVLAHLVEQHRAVWDRIEREKGKELQKVRDRLGWTDRDVLVMASIVEKEAVLDRERPRIAQVFINRLTSPSFHPKVLQTDPTIRYGCIVPLEKSAACKKWNPGDRLHDAQLHDPDNPYNTYTHEGLPPGPICSPGERSLRATVDPDGSDYYYFVASPKGDHSHVFARTVAEHERNVQKYVRGSP